MTTRVGLLLNCLRLYTDCRWQQISVYLAGRVSENPTPESRRSLLLLPPPLVVVNVTGISWQRPLPTVSSQWSTSTGNCPSSSDMPPGLADVLSSLCVERSSVIYTDQPASSLNAGNQYSESTRHTVSSAQLLFSDELTVLRYVQQTSL